MIQLGQTHYLQCKFYSVTSENVFYHVIIYVTIMYFFQYYPALYNCIMNYLEHCLSYVYIYKVYVTISGHEYLGRYLKSVHVLLLTLLLLQYR